MAYSTKTFWITTAITTVLGVLAGRGFVTAGCRTMTSVIPNPRQPVRRW